MSTCKKPYLITLDDGSQAYECYAPYTQRGCEYCHPVTRIKNMSQLNVQLIDDPSRWKEIPYDQVKPGDVAVCGEVQWSIIEDRTNSSWKMALHDGGFLLKTSWVYKEMQIKFYTPKEFMSFVEDSPSVGKHIKVADLEPGTKVIVRPIGG